MNPILKRCMIFVAPVMKPTMDRLVNWLEKWWSDTLLRGYAEARDEGQYDFWHSGIFSKDDLAEFGGTMVEEYPVSMKEAAFDNFDHRFTRATFEEENHALAFYMAHADRIQRVQGFVKPIFN